MYKHILESAGDINWMAIFALVTFVTIFIIGSITVLRRDSDFINKMANMPLDNSDPLTSETTDSHEK